MNYNCDPDIPSGEHLTVQNVVLFQRFRQERDLQMVSDWLNLTVAKHIKLCELFILYYASCRYYWAPLPQHPLTDVNIRTFRHLKEAGFEIKHQNRESDSGAGWFAHWFERQIKDGDRVAAEWKRREHLEDEKLKANPPKPMSETSADQVSDKGAIWAAILDGKYIAEVQRLYERNFICIFDRSEGRCLHFEETEVAFGAVFGPDVDNIRRWEERCAEIVANIHGSLP